MRIFNLYNVDFNLSKQPLAGEHQIGKAPLKARRNNGELTIEIIFSPFIRRRRFVSEPTVPHCAMLN